MSARVKMGRFQNAGTHTPPSRPVSRSLRRKSKVYNHASAQNVDEEVGEEKGEIRGIRGIRGIQRRRTDHADHEHVPG